MLGEKIVTVLVRQSSVQSVKLGGLSWQHPPGLKISWVLIKTKCSGSFYRYFELFPYSGLLCFIEQRSAWYSCSQNSWFCYKAFLDFLLQRLSYRPARVFPVWRPTTQMPIRLPTTARSGPLSACYQVHARTQPRLRACPLSVVRNNGIWTYAPYNPLKFVKSFPHKRILPLKLCIF